MGDREQDKGRLDVWFISNKMFKPTKRVTFRMCTFEGMLDILDKAKAVVELFKLYDDIQFAISDDTSI